MCLGMNPDQLARRAVRVDEQPQLRGRQGKGGRTHLVSPLVAAATAVLGRLASPSDLPCEWRPDMEKFTTHTGVAAPLTRSAVDTDQIIPAVYLKRVTKTGFDDALFANWRQDPEFVLNQPAVRRASVLVAGPDFGTGSSREHAVWALRDYGFQVVLSPKFADIFRGNAGKQGLSPASSPEADIEADLGAIEEDPGRDDGRPRGAHGATG
jgi:3-isopropylmalate dehydratase small subunit